MKKGRKMKFLEELEQKILLLIQNNKDLALKVQHLDEENSILKAQNEHFQKLLLQETTEARNIIEEKEAMVVAVQKLLSSIKALENPQERVD